MKDPVEMGKLAIQDWKTIAGAASLSVLEGVDSGPGTGEEGWVLETQGSTRPLPGAWAEKCVDTRQVHGEIGRSLHVFATDTHWWLRIGNWEGDSVC